MKTITLFTVFPAGQEKEEYDRMQQFTQELNRFYERFGLVIQLRDYENTLRLGKGDRYSVKPLRTVLYPIVEESVLCCLIFLCKKEELVPEDMNLLIQNLSRQKKAEILVYFRPKPDMQPVRNDILRHIVEIDERTVVPVEDRPRLSSMAKDFLNLGCASDREHKLNQAETAYRESLIIQKKLAAADEDTYLQDLALPYHNLGTLYFRTNRMKDAEMMFAEAYRIRQRLVELKGDIYRSMEAASGNNLAAVYMRTNRLEEAKHLYLDVLEIRKQMADERQDEASSLLLADIHANLGGLYNQMEKPEEAEASYKEALKLEEGILSSLSAQSGTENSEPAKSEASNTEVPTDLSLTGVKRKTAATHNTLGVLYLKLKQPEAAEIEYDRSRVLYEDLVKQKPEEYEPHLSMVYYNLFHVYRGMGRMKEAEFFARKSMEICVRYKDTSNLCKQLFDSVQQLMKEGQEKQAEMASMLEKQGQEKQEQGLFEEAVSCHQQAAGLYQALGGKENLSKAALIYSDLGLLCWDTQQLSQAEFCYKNALAIYRDLSRYDPSLLPSTAVASYNLGIFYQDTRDEEVNEYLREAFETAAKCLNDSEQCREIYENLQDEPLYRDLEAGEPDLEEGTDPTEEGSALPAEDLPEESEAASAFTEEELPSENEATFESDPGPNREIPVGNREEPDDKANEPRKKEGGFFHRLFGKK